MCTKNTRYTQTKSERARKNCTEKKATLNENNKQITSSNSFWPLPQSFIIYKHKQNHPQPSLRDENEHENAKHKRRTEIEHAVEQRKKRIQRSTASNIAEIRQQYGNLFTASCHRHSLFSIPVPLTRTHYHSRPPPISFQYIYNFNLIYYSLKIVLALQFVVHFFFSCRCCGGRHFSLPHFGESICTRISNIPSRFEWCLFIKIGIEALRTITIILFEWRKARMRKRARHEKIHLQRSYIQKSSVR